MTTPADIRAMLDARPGWSHEQHLAIRRGLHRGLHRGTLRRVSIHAATTTARVLYPDAADLQSAYVGWHTRRFRQWLEPLPSVEN